MTENMIEIKQADRNNFRETSMDSCTDWESIRRIVAAE
jgi:hypothetical protein